MQAFIHRNNGLKYMCFRFDISVPFTKNTTYCVRWLAVMRFVFVVTEAVFRLI